MGSQTFLEFLLLASISINVTKEQTCNENSNVIQNAIGGGSCAVGVTDTAKPRTCCVCLRGRGHNGSPAN
jgi:hypothetical protein